MALIVDGTTIPNTYDVDYFGNTVNKIRFNNTTVWRKKLSKSVTVTIDFSILNVPNEEDGTEYAARVRLSASIPNAIRIRLDAYEKNGDAYNAGAYATIEAGSTEGWAYVTLVGHGANMTYPTYCKLYLTTYLNATGSYVAPESGSAGIESGNLPTTSGDMTARVSKTLTLYYDLA